LNSYSFTKAFARERLQLLKFHKG